MGLDVAEEDVDGLQVHQALTPANAMAQRHRLGLDALEAAVLKALAEDIYGNQSGMAMLSVPVAGVVKPGFILNRDDLYPLAERVRVRMNGQIGTDEPRLEGEAMPLEGGALRIMESGGKLDVALPVEALLAWRKYRVTAPGESRATSV